jgi:hypothetical protein
MAYFSNSSEGSGFEYQCSICRYGDESCPIFLVQFIYNYDACNNKIARKILDSLIHDDGTCEMFKTFKKDFTKDNSPSLFDICFPELKDE